MKITKNKLKDMAMKHIVSKSIRTAGQSVNSACVWWLGQPKPPKSLKKLRRF
ncbi:MAG: cyclic lactone autoinducer peptide [Butyrivibrio sp.]